jgi:pyruvate/2-oxoglutarate dehydrogenase complex dihydrolipoamide dehydrogenase (E3) component
MSYDFDLVCIGSGPAGQRAAIQAAKLGKRAAVIERAASSAASAMTPYACSCPWRLQARGP